MESILDLSSTGRFGVAIVIAAVLLMAYTGNLFPDRSTTKEKDKWDANIRGKLDGIDSHHKLNLILFRGGWLAVVIGTMLIVFG